MITAVIFDLDGTLINLPINYKKLFQEFSKIMKTEDVQPLTEKLAGLNEETRKRVFDVWDRFELEASRDFTVSKEVVALYQRLSKVPKALVTMQGKILVNNVIKRLGLAFDFTITREDSLNRTEQLQRAARMLKAHPQNILFVGNTDEDYIAAKRVGCRFLRVKNESMV